VRAQSHFPRLKTPGLRLLIDHRGASAQTPDVGSNGYETRKVGGPRRRMGLAQEDATITTNSRLNSGRVLNCVRPGRQSQCTWVELALAKNTQAGHGAPEGREFSVFLLRGAAGQSSLCSRGIADTMTRYARAMPIATARYSPARFLANLCAAVPYVGKPLLAFDTGVIVAEDRTLVNTASANVIISPGPVVSRGARRAGRPGPRTDADGGTESAPHVPTQREWTIVLGSCCAVAAARWKSG
jgi:hypothetical protein